MAKPYPSVISDNPSFTPDNPSVIPAKRTGSPIKDVGDGSRVFTLSFVRKTTTLDSCFRRNDRKAVRNDRRRIGVTDSSFFYTNALG